MPTLCAAWQQPSRNTTSPFCGRLSRAVGHGDFTRQTPTMTAALCMRVMPIVYQRRGDFAARAQAWLATHYSVEKGIYHYRSAAKKNFSQYLCSPQVKLKKYLYVLRPLLAVRWLERYGEVAPIEFEVLRTVLDHPTVQAAIDTLLAVKRHVSEQATQAPVAVLHDWIVQEIARLQHYQGISGQADPAVWPTLNTLFVEVLRP
jgi:predicted nucleotidyltransferase